MKKYLFIILLLAWYQFVTAQSADAILGVWRDGNGKGNIQIYKQNGKYFGKIIWMKTLKSPDGKPKIDRHNPNPALRNRSVVGIIMLRDFKYDDDEWTDGYIYNPLDGKEYKGFMRLKDANTLAVRGYIGISWIGKTDTWIRVK